MQENALTKDYMRDDKGIFQGGEQGRIFGRFRDAMDKKKEEKTFNKARDFAKSFNPQDPEEVKQMQQHLNSQGAGLDEDGQLGPKTLESLRKFQMGGEQSDVFSPVRAPEGVNPPMNAGVNAPIQSEQQNKQRISNLVGMDLPAFEGSGGVTPMQAPDIPAGLGPYVPDAPAPQQQPGPWAQGQDPFGFGTQQNSNGTIGEQQAGANPWDISQIKMGGGPKY